MKSLQYYQDLQARCTSGIEAQVLESWERGMFWTENVNLVEMKVIVNHLDDGSCGRLATLDSHMNGETIWGY